MVTQHDVPRGREVADLTTTERLRRLGLGHRRIAGCQLRRHEVFGLETGEIIPALADVNVWDVNRWLAARGA